MAIERICVVGAGAIGGLYAGHLARVSDVTVLTRRPEQAAALNEAGLRVSGKSDLRARVTASHEPEGIDDVDVAIVACKAVDLPQTAARLKGSFRRAAVMTVQNGLGAEEVVRKHGEWPLISAVTFMSGTRRSDTHVEYELDTATWMGPYMGGGPPYETVQELEALLIEGGLEAEAMPDLRPAQWSKLIFNAAVNGVAALTHLPHVRAFAEEDEFADLGHLLRGLIDEGKAVAEAAGVELHDDPWEMNVRAVTHGETLRSDYAHIPSMLADVRARRPTEVDYISGALAREGGRLGVPTPLNTAIYRLIKAKESSWR
ncbi:MAG TPA: 2-dehydropantoate 2-reductase [Thermoleophilaceae bacterium]|nr:2-dehydropantoate 2-reductase [Thermoleophilaceae bacterium]